MKCVLVFFQFQSEEEWALAADNLQEVQIPVTECTRSYNQDEFQICGGTSEWGNKSLNIIFSLTVIYFF